MNILKLLMVVLLGTTLMSAQATRTWVSGVGDDANPCSRTAPCKTFAGAISKTAAGGEIDALDPGGFGAVTITKSITLDGGGGQVASVLVAGTNGIVVAAQSSDVVILRNLRLDGLRGAGNANAGINGIHFISGAALHIDNCFIFGFNNNGINVATAGGKVTVDDTISTNNGQSGLAVQSTALTLVSVNNSHFDFNAFGVLAGSFGKINVSNSTASNNSQNGYTASGSAGNPELNLSNSVASNNAGSAVQSGGGTAPALVRATGNTFFGNPGGGFTIAANGTIKSWGNNFSSDAGTVTAPNLTPQ